MSHLYPLATNALAALADPDLAARSKADAVRLCPMKDHHIDRLETEWLTLSGEKGSELGPAADAGVSAGFVQRYENTEGAMVLAVSYWKIIPDKAPAVASEAVAKQDPNLEPKPDHTDDLYFRVGRTKKRSRRKKKDPNQLDLFGEQDG